MKGWGLKHVNFVVVVSSVAQNDQVAMKAFVVTIVWTLTVSIQQISQHVPGTRNTVEGKLCPCFADSFSLYAFSLESGEAPICSSKRNVKFTEMKQLDWGQTASGRAGMQPDLPSSKGKRFTQHAIVSFISISRQDQMCSALAVPAAGGSVAWHTLGSLCRKSRSR